MEGQKRFQCIIIVSSLICVGNSSDDVGGSSKRVELSSDDPLASFSGPDRKRMRNGSDEVEEEEGESEMWFFKKLLKGYDKAVYPTFKDKGVPTVITCNIYVRSFGSISAADMDFTVDVYMRQEWVDARLSQDFYPHTFRLMDESLIHQLWIPDTYFPDVKRGSFHHITVPNVGMIIYPNGSVFYSARLTMVFACNMNLRFFPFDKQTCYMELGSYFHTEDQLVYEWAGAGIDFLDGIAMPLLKIVNIHSRQRREKAFQGVYSGLIAEITLERQYGYDLVQTYLPSLMVVAISWVSCWLDVDSIPARTTLGVTTLLTITTQSSGVRSSLPPVSYIKGVDIWLGICTFFVFGVLLEFTFVNYLSRKRPTKVKRNKSIKLDAERRREESNSWMEIELDEELKPKTGKELSEMQTKYIQDYVAAKHRQAVKVDKVSRVAFPLTFFIFNIIYWPYYLFYPQ